MAVIDGYHLQIRPPSKFKVRNIKSFFSGHYQAYGLNIQPACDHSCPFLFIGVAGPGVKGNRDAIKQIRLGSLIESLSGLHCAIGDSAYTAIEHLVPIFRGENARSARNDNFRNSFWFDGEQVSNSHTASRNQSSQGKAIDCCNWTTSQFLD